MVRFRGANAARVRPNTAESRYQLFIYAVVAALLVIAVFPLVYVVCVSLTSEAEWLERGNLMLIPLRPTVAAYRRIFVTNSLMMNSFLISVARTVCGTSLEIPCTLITGYIASRRDMPGSKVLMFMVLITTLFSGGLIPTFLVVKDTGLYNSFLAMIIPGLLNSWGMLVFRQFFLNLPHEIEESAEVDGITKLGLMLRIVIPMSAAVLAAMGLFVAVAHWNSWFDALIYIANNQLKPLQLILYNMNADANLGYNVNDLTNYDLRARVSTRSLRMALTMIGTVPILCVYPFLQKYFVKGVYVGAIKG